MAAADSSHVLTAHSSPEKGANSVVAIVFFEEKQRTHFRHQPQCFSQMMGNTL